MLIIDTIVSGTHPFPSLSELLFPIFKNCTIWWSALFWPAFNGPTKSVKSKFSRKGLYKIYDAWSECHSLQISGLSPALDTGHTQLNVHISFTEPSLFPQSRKIKFERFRQNHYTWKKIGKERILPDGQIRDPNHEDWFDEHNQVINYAKDLIKIQWEMLVDFLFLHFPWHSS